MLASLEQFVERTVFGAHATAGAPNPDQGMERQRWRDVLHRRGVPADAGGWATEWPSSRCRAATIHGCRVRVPSPPTCRTGPSPSPKPWPAAWAATASTRSDLVAPFTGVRIPAPFAALEPVDRRTSRVARVRRSGVPERSVGRDRHRHAGAAAPPRERSRSPCPRPDAPFAVAASVGGCSRFAPRNSRSWRGVRLTNPARTWCDLADGR